MEINDVFGIMRQNQTIGIIGMGEAVLAGPLPDTDPPRVSV